MPIVDTEPAQLYSFMDILRNVKETGHKGPLKLVIYPQSIGHLEWTCRELVVYNVTPHESSGKFMLKVMYRGQGPADLQIDPEAFIWLNLGTNQATW